MPHVELKLGQETFPIQPQGTDQITSPGLIPVGSKLAKISFISAPSFYNGIGFLYLFGERDREAVFELPLYGGHPEFNVEAFSQFYFGMNPLPGKFDYFSFQFYFDDGRHRLKEEPSAMVGRGQKARYVLQDAMKAGLPVRIVPQVIDGVPWIHEYMGKKYWVASVRDQSGLIPNTVLLPPGPTLPTEEFELRVQNVRGIATVLHSPIYTEPAESAFPWIVNE